MFKIHSKKMLTLTYLWLQFIDKVSALREHEDTDSPWDSEVLFIIIVIIVILNVSIDHVLQNGPMEGDKILLLYGPPLSRGPPVLGSPCLPPGNYNDVRDW